MAIDRTLFNLWVNDDGSNTVGTLINKSRIATDLLDPIDAALGTPGITTSGTRVTQIAFAAAQSASADANTLDDYEEGAWTPVIGGAGGTSGQTYSTQSGHYVKVGQLVFVRAYIALSAKGTITGSAQIQGLPFTTFSAGVPHGTMALQWSALLTNWVDVITQFINNSTAANLSGATAAAAGNDTALVAADIGNATILTFAGCYRAAA